ncbi:MULTISPECIES: urea transporter [Nitrosospira]|uniref:urea transporter n=1 Tax=Nitrosospira TaxID=35798 RepID=UPI000944DB32|nr:MULTISPECIES: urea transporter [Nitrosospira]
MNWLLKIDEALPRSLRVILRGVGQVVFCGNAVTGFIFLAAFYINDAMAGLAATLGAVSSTAAAIALKCSRSDIDAGLYGFNGTLAGACLWTFLGHTPQLWLYIVLAAMLSSMVFAFMTKPSALPFTFQIPPATAPFVLICWIFILAVPAVDHAFDIGPDVRAVDPDLPIPASSGSMPGAGSAWAGMRPALLIKGVSQVFFADSLAVGILILIGVALASPRGALLLAGGAFTGSLVATLLEADYHATEIGLYGFNAGLASVAVGQIFLRPDTRSALLAVLASVLAPLVQIGFSQIFLLANLPVLAAPFLFVLWVVLFIAGRWQRWRPSPLEKPVEPA